MIMIAVRNSTTLAIKGDIHEARSLIKEARRTEEAEHPVALIQSAILRSSAVHLLTKAAFELKMAGQARRALIVVSHVNPEKEKARGNVVKAFDSISPEGSDALGYILNR